MKEHRLGEVRTLCRVKWYDLNPAPVWSQEPYSFCNILLVLGLLWEDFKEKSVTFFFLKVRKEATFPDISATWNSTVFPCGSWILSFNRRKFV